MLDHFLLVMQQVVTLFLMMGTGFFLVRKGMLTSEGTGQMTLILLYVVSPCLLIDALAIERTPGMLLTFGSFFLAYGIPSILNMALSRLFFRKTAEKTRAALWFGLGFSNNGYMGLPLLSSIFGAEGLIYGVISTVVFNLLMWTYGVKTMGGKMTLRQALINPATVGVAIAMPLFLTGAWQPNDSGFFLPPPILSAAGFFSDLNTPLAMIIVGAQMAQGSFRECFTNLRLYQAAALRLVFFPLLAMILLIPFKLPSVLYCTAVILCGAPTAGATGMLAQRYDGDTATASQMVTLSTLLSLISLPVLATVAQQVSHLW